MRRFVVPAFAGVLLTSAFVGLSTTPLAQNEDDEALGGSGELPALSLPAARPMTSSTLGLFNTVEIGGTLITGAALTMTSFEVGQGDTLIDLLVEAGSTANDADGAIDALGRIYDPRRLQIGQVVTAVFRSFDETDEELAVVSIALDESDYVVATRPEGGSFEAERIDEPLSDALLAPIPATTTPDIDTNLITREMEVRRGDTLVRLAVRAGATRSDANIAIDALTRLIDPTSLQIGQILQVSFSGSGAETALAALSLQTGEETYVVSERLASGNFDAYWSDRPFTAPSPALAAGDLDVGGAIDALRAEGAAVDRMTIAQGDTLMDLMVEAGATITDAHEAARVLARHFDPRGLQIGQHLYVVRTPGPAGSGLKVLGLVVLDAGDDGVVVVNRLPEEGFEGRRIADTTEIALALPGTAAHADTESALDVSGAESKTPQEDEVADIPDMIDFGSQLRVEEMEVQSGDTLMSLLLRAGANRVEADRAISALRPHYDPRHLQIGQQIRVAFDTLSGVSESLVTISIRIKDNLFVQADVAGDSFVAGRTTTPINPAFAASAPATPPAADIDSLIRESEGQEVVQELPNAEASEEITVADAPSTEPAPPPVTDAEGQTELSTLAEQVWFVTVEGDSIAALLRTLTANGKEVTDLVDLLSEEMDIVEIEADRELVVITDQDGAGTHIVALSLDIDNGDTIAVVAQLDGGFKARRASSHVDLSDFAMAAIQVPVPEESTAFGPWQGDADALTSASFEIAAGGTLMNGLLDLGIDAVQADTAIDSLRDVFDPRSIRAGQMVDVTLEGDVLQSISMSPRAGERVEIVRDGDDFASRMVELPTELVLRAAVGRIDSSLYQAALDSGVPPAVLADMIRAYSFDVDFQREIQTGDSFEILYEEFIDEDGNTVRYGPPLYATLRVSGVTLPIYRFTPSSGFIDYFNEQGESVRKALIRTPIDGAQITSNFGMRTLGGYTRMHKGTDFGAPTGTPIMAAGDGVIDQLGWYGGYGNYVRIRHNSTYSTAYAHMSSYASGLGEGSRVRQGQIIGYVGSTGNSTGPHLHYEVLVNGEQINPLDVRLPSGEILEGAELDTFLAVRDDLDALFADHLDGQLVASGD